MKNIKDFITNPSDISENGKLMAELVLSEKKFKSLIQDFGDIITITDGKGIYSFVSNSILSILGILPGELVGKSMLDFIHSDDKDRVYDSFLQLKNQQTIKIDPFRFRRKDGSFQWFETVLANKENEPAVNGIVAISRDASDAVAATEKIAALLKKEVETRNFAMHQNNLLENEWSRIARQIHDEFGQQLAGVKMSLSTLLKPLASDNQATETLRGLISEVDETMQSLRKFATELRPGILDTLGIITSIEWLVEEFENKTAITSQVHVNVKGHSFENALSTCFFRVCEEALSNVSKHAQATEVVIHVTQWNDELKLTIRDNGKGIVNELLDSPLSMGILGMKERANLIGARLSIISEINEGTMIIITAKINGD